MEWTLSGKLSARRKESHQAAGWRRGQAQTGGRGELAAAGKVQHGGRVDYQILPLVHPPRRLPDRQRLHACVAA